MHIQCAQLDESRHVRTPTHHHHNHGGTPPASRFLVSVFRGVFVCFFMVCFGLFCVCVVRAHHMRATLVTNAGVCNATLLTTGAAQN